MPARGRLLTPEIIHGVDGPGLARWPREVLHSLGRSKVPADLSIMVNREEGTPGLQDATCEASTMSGVQVVCVLEGAGQKTWQGRMRSQRSMPPRQQPQRATRSWRAFLVATISRRPPFRERVQRSRRKPYLEIIWDRISRVFEHCYEKAPQETGTGRRRRSWIELSYKPLAPLGRESGGGQSMA